MKLEDRLKDVADKSSPVATLKGVPNPMVNPAHIKEAREAIYKDLDTLLGENEPIDVGRYENGRDMWGEEWARLHNAEPKARNNHRAELRNKLKGYCGVEG